MKKVNRFPPGWDEERVRELIRHYDEQTEAEAIAEDEAVYEDPATAIVLVPKELVHDVEALIARHAASLERTAADA